MQELIEYTKKCHDDLLFYCRNEVKIRTKKGTVTELNLNKAQSYIHEKLEEQKAKTGKVRAIILKARQQGCSTYVAARFFHKTTFNKGIKTFILTHQQEATENLFEMVSRVYEHSDVAPKASTDNAKELYFKDIDSGYKIGTAGSRGVGRSQTIQVFHGCVAEDSLIVLSDGGTKQIKDITIGDKVRTSSGAIADVSALIETGTKQVYKVSTWLTNETIEVSADHKILTQRGWQKLEDITCDDYIQQPNIKLDQSIETREFFLPNLKRPQNGGSRHQEYANIKLDYNAGYFFGYYLAEGHVRKQQKTNRKSYVNFCYHEDEDYIAPVIEFAAQFCTKYATQRIPKQHKKITTFYCTFLAELTNDWFGRVESKHIPEWVFNAPKEFVLGLIDGYYNGDGSKTEIGRKRAKSIHERIARQMKRLINSITDGICGLHYYEQDRYGIQSKPVLVTAINGRAYDGLFGSKKDSYRNERFITKDGKKFVKIRSITPTGIKQTYDIEVNHPDHDFETPIGIISNSEAAFWQKGEEHSAGILQAVADMEGTEIIFESTANGISNFFYKICMEALEGKSEYQLIFVPWFWQDEYSKPLDEPINLSPEESLLKEKYSLTDEQLNWRRKKIQELGADKVGEKLFCQEYPSSIQEAFVHSYDDPYISLELVEEAMRNDINDSLNQAPVLIGCDPARGGKDETGITIRQGRKVHSCYGIDVNDTMQICGALVQLDKQFKAKKIFIDSIGIGAGVVDRMIEMGYSGKIVPVNSAETKSLLYSDRYSNKRAEMWGQMKEWLEDKPVSLPNSEKLKLQMITLSYGWDSKGRLKMQDKAEVDKSPDLADSLALTFAFPVSTNARYDLKRNLEFA